MAYLTTKDTEAFTERIAFIDNRIYLLFNCHYEEERRSNLVVVLFVIHNYEIAALRSQ